MDERLAPFFAVNRGLLDEGRGLAANLFDRSAHPANDQLGAFRNAGDGGDEANVLLDVRERMGASASTGQPALRMASSDSLRYGTDAITRSGRSGSSSSALVDHESWTTAIGRWRSAGKASRQ